MDATAFDLDRKRLLGTPVDLIYRPSCTYLRKGAFAPSLIRIRRIVSDYGTVDGLEPLSALGLVAAKPAVSPFRIRQPGYC